MDNTKNLRIVFTGDTASVVAAFDAVQKKSVDTQAKTTSLGQSLEQLGTKSKQIGSELSSLGGSLTVGLTLPILGIGFAAAKMATDFQQQMTYVRTDAGDTTDDINKLSDSVLNLAKSSQFGPDELAKGLYHLASLGLRGADAMNALNTAQQMASVGGADLESTASALGAALVSGIKGVQDYSEAAGTLDAIIGAGNMRMGELVNALGTGVLPVFKNAGLSITDFGAALATLTDNGMQADEAATRLKMTISLMEAPSKKAQGALAAIGMTSNQLGMDMQTKGLIPALQDLNQHLLDTYGTTAAGRQQMAQALTEMFGGGRSSAAIQTLLDQIDRVQNKFTQITAQTGEFSDKVAEQQQTASAKIKTAWSSVQADLIQLGGDVLPAVANAFTSVTKEVDKLTGWWGSLTDGQKKMVEQTALMLAVAGPGLSVLGKMVSTFGTIAKLGGLAANGIGTVARAFSGVASIGGMASVGAEAGVATEAAAGLGAILTGPVLVGLLGTVAVAGLAYIAYKKWTDAGITPATKQLSDFNRLAKDLNYTLTPVPSTVDLVTLANIHLKDSQALVKTATDDVKKANDKLSDSQGIVKQASDDVRKAQDAVTDAADKYGKNSPQYIDAVQKLSDKQQDLYSKELATWGISVDLKTAQDNLRDANREAGDAAAYEAGIQDRLNKGLDSGNTVIARFGTTALQQVNAIDTLQVHIANVVKSFGDLSTNIQGSSPLLGKTLQGLGSTIDRVQQQSSALNTSIQHTSSLQVGTGSGLQGGKMASGTDYAPGGWTLVGEEGPEIVQMPRGSQVLNARDTQNVTNNRSVTIGTIILGSADAVKEMFSQLDRDNLLVMKGLSPARGL